MSRARLHNLPPRPRGGFSFVEIMFAVVILGIGFIMVAAIFPVAISQNQVTGEQASSSAFARVSASVMQQLSVYNAAISGYNLTPTQSTAASPTYVFPFDSLSTTNAFPSTTIPYPHGSFAAVAGSLISSADPRFAVVPLYSLSANGTVAQCYFFNVTSRNAPTYTSTDVTPVTPAATVGQVQCTLTPKLTQATITQGTPSLISFLIPTAASPAWTLPATSQQPTYSICASGTPASGATPANGGNGAVGTGCYVLVANDAIAGAGAGTYNGKVYKVGNQRLDLDSTGFVWELAPGGDFSPPAGSTITKLTGADVWIVGRGLQDHTRAYASSSPGPANTYTDNVQDVSFYTTYVPLQ